MLVAAFGLSACDKDDDNPNEDNGHDLNVPSTYAFSDDDGNSTVSFNGQAQRLEMLDEMTVLMKTANTSGTAVDASMLKDMYANNGVTWIDAPSLGMTESTKQLKNKTAAASGTADPAIQAYFEGLMDDLANLSATTTTGNDNGGPGTGGVVVSSSNPSKKYLMSAEGQEYTQLIEKGLMGAVFYNQICMVYLGEGKMNVDNTTAVDPDNGKFYTTMEHHWDEAYGYFTTAVDYAPDGNGTDRFWGKYADGRETLLGSATALGNAFRRGRAAIAANDLGERDAQIAIIRHEMELVAAGTAIHYLNGSIADFSDHALRNHQMSEAIAFLNALPYGYMPVADQAQVGNWLNTIGQDLYNVTTSQILQVRDELAALAGLEDVKEDL